MTDQPTFEIFLAGTPGLESELLAEARAAGFPAEATPGGAAFRGGWADVMRANLTLRGANRVLARIDAFPAAHLSQLAKRAAKTPWGSVLRKDEPVRVEAVCRRSKIYHSGAAAERIERAILEAVGAPIVREKEGDAVEVRVRLFDNLCTVSVDTSGALLHKRGFKEAVAKAPLRETMAAMLLRACGYDGTEPLLDPMCGSGTFVVEAAELALGLAPGRERRFAFERLATFDEEAWEAMRAQPTPRETSVRLFGFDKDAGAVRASAANAERAGVAAITEFRQQTVTQLERPEGPPGLVMVNPPYGARIGDRGALTALYRTLGRRLLAGFSGWRVGLLTSDVNLANATGLPFTERYAPIDHGGLKVRLFRTDALA